MKRHVGMEYRFKASSRIGGVSAQAVGELCERLSREDGGLTPKRLLDANRREGAPLHRYFVWDDAEAAELYREGQASHVIRCLVVRAGGGEESVPVRAFASVRTAGGGEDEEDGGGRREYMPIGRVVGDAGYREQMLADALRDLQAFELKYRTLAELAPVFDAAASVAAARGAPGAGRPAEAPPPSEARKARKARKGG